MKITKEDRSILIASCIGKSYLNKKGILEVYEKDPKDLEYKLRMLKKFRNSHTVTANSFRCKTTKYSRLLRRILFPENRLVITRKIASKLTSRSLAILYQDFGFRGQRFNYRLTLENAEVLRDVFKDKFALDFKVIKIKNSYYLKCNKMTQQRFYSIVEPFLMVSSRHEPKRFEPRTG